MIKNIDPNYVPVRCTACDAVVYVPAGTVVNHPYICTCCQQRALKRMARNSEPMFGRMRHGDYVKQEAQKQ